MIERVRYCGRSVCLTRCDIIRILENTYVCIVEGITLLPIQIRATTISILGIVGCVSKLHKFHKIHKSLCGWATKHTHIPRTEHTCYVDRAQTFHRHGTDDTRLAAQQFTGIRNGIPRNMSDFHKLLVTCTVGLVFVVVPFPNHFGSMISKNHISNPF